MSDQHRQACRKSGKAPLIGNWAKRASNDPETIIAWFSKYRTANIGILTGEAGGIVAIDIDGDYGRTRLEELSGENVPATWEFTTPGGGYRYLFLAPADTLLQKYADALPGEDHQELAFLGERNQTVMPPSVHKNGGTYQWVDGRSPTDIDLAPAPDWMIQKMSLAIAADSLFDDGDQAPLFHQEFPSSQEELHTPELRAKSASKTSADHPVVGYVQSSPTIHSSDISETLRTKCSKVAEAWELQGGPGCDWHRWFHVASLLVKAEAPDEAMRFSEASHKHNEQSRSEIEAMAKKAFGPTRCATLGCGPERIKWCFGRLRTNGKGEITNSPVAFLKVNKAASTSEIVDLVEKYTEYRIRSGEIGEVATNKEGIETFKPFANFVPIPKEDVCLDDGATQERCFVISGQLLDDNSELPPLRVSEQDFHDPVKWVVRWGLRPTIYPGHLNKEKIRHATQLLSQNAKSTVVYTHLGYCMIAGEWKYLHAGGCSDDDSVKVELDDRLERYVLPADETDSVAAVRLCFSLLEVAKEHVTLPLLATMFLTPLCQVLRTIGLEPAFVVWLYGQTGARKSTLAALFMSLFGSFTAKSPPASFRDTANSLERRAFACKDSVLWVDDFHPSANSLDARKMEQVAQFHIRSFGDRTGRARMRSDTTLREGLPPKGLALDTGEQLPDNQSSNARLATLELLPEDVNLAKLTEAQGQASKLPEAMLGYTRWVGKQMSDDKFSRHLKERFHELREEAQAPPSHGRIAETAAWLQLGLECFLDYAESVEAINPEENEVKRDNGWKLMLTVSDTQNDNVREAMPVKQFLDIVSEMLLNGTLHVLDLDKAYESGSDDRVFPVNHVGWRDKKFYYFLPNSLYTEVSAFLGKQNMHIPLKQAALWKQLDAEGALSTEETEEKGVTKVKRIKRKSIPYQGKVSVLWVKAEFLRDNSYTAPTRESSILKRLSVIQKDPAGLFD